MSRLLKMRMAVLLSVILVLPTVLGVLPMTELQVEAAKWQDITWSIYTSGKPVEIEAGQKFNIGDYAYTYSQGDEWMKYTASMVKASYKSSNTAVAKVDSKGNMETLTPGETTITITYKGKKIKQNFVVVEAGTYSDSEQIEKAAQAAATLSKLPKSITTKNGFKYLKLRENYKNEMKNLTDAVSESGFLQKKVEIGSYSYYTSSNVLVVPQCGRITTLEALLSNYGCKNNPTSTRSSKGLKISSASASVKSNTITINLKKKVTKEQILGARIYEMYSDPIGKESPTNKQAFLRIHVFNKTKSYTGWCLLREGSKKVTVKLYSLKYNGSKTTVKRVKIKKGQTYTLGSKVLNWTQGVKVKAQ